jgi:hypothetical protein
VAQSHREAAQKLFEYALDQQGFFTAKQVGSWTRASRHLPCTAQDVIAAVESVRCPLLLFGRKDHLARR